MKRLVVLLLPVILSLPSLVCAQRTDTAGEAAAKMEDMVVTATRTEEPLKEIPGRVEVITKKELDEMPVQTVDEALSYISGAQSTRWSGIYSFRVWLTLRGLGGTQQGRTLVLLDGAPMNTADLGDVNWNRINLEDVARIEVLKGPAAAVYGNNAMGGVINIITQKPTKYVSGMAKASYGTYDDWKLHGVAAFRTSEDPKGLYARVSGLYHNSPGYKSAPDDMQTLYSVKSFVREKTIGGKVGWDLNEENNLELNYARDEQSFGEGTQYFAYDGLHRTFDTDYWQARYTGSWAGWSGQINAYFTNEHHERFNETWSNTSDISTYSRVDSKIIRQNYGVLTSLSKQWAFNTFTAGFDFRQGNLDGTDYYRTAPDFATNYGKMRNFGVFLQDQLRFFDGKLIILAGLRYDNATTFDGHYDTTLSALSKYNQYFPDHTWDQWSPRASAKYFILDNLSVYASYGHAFRAPLLDYMYRNGQMKGGNYQLANPSLSPETLDSFEVGGDWQPLDNLKFSGSGYFSVGHDFLYNVTAGTKLYQYQNVGQVQIWGMEWDAEYAPFKDKNIPLLKRFTLFGNYTFNDSRIADFPGRPDLVGKLLANVPQNSFNVGFNWLNPYVNNRVAVQYVGLQYTDDLNSSGLTIAPHALLNAKLWRNLDFLGAYGDKVELSLTAENILDHRYISVRNTNGENPGRMLFLELTCKF